MKEKDLGLKFAEENRQPKHVSIEYRVSIK